MTDRNAYMREYSARPEAKAKKKARAARWYRENADRLRKKAQENRLANLEYYRAYDRERGFRGHPEKTRCRKIAYNAIQRGQLHRQPCEVCGADLVHAHHDDYTKPLDVRWLCRAHHMEIHRRVGDG